jgi:hypothetical protein
MRRHIMDFTANSIIWTLVIGLVVGAIAKRLTPGKDPRRLHHHHSARNRRGLCRHLDRPPLRGRELRRRLDHVDRRRDAFALVLPINF